MSKRASVGLLFIVGITLLGSPQNADAQNFSCWANGANGCCYCDVEWWTQWVWCYEYGFVGSATCETDLFTCELQGYCSSWAMADDLAPDGSVYLAVDSREPGEAANVALHLGPGHGIVVGCGGAIAERHYSGEVLAALRERLKTLSI